MWGLGWKTVLFKRILALTQLRQAGSMQSFVAVVSTKISMWALAVVAARLIYNRETTLRLCKR